MFHIKIFNWKFMRGAGFAFYPFIVFKKSKEDVPHHLIEHELVHLKQHKKYWFIGFAFLYNFSKKWRLKFETEAYAVSVMNGLLLEHAVYYLKLPMYGTQNRSTKKIRDDLSKEIDRLRNS